MKNNLYRDFYIPLKMTNKHILRIMKITFTFLFIFITGLFATEASSQVAKVSINSENINIQTLINQIEQQTDYLFIFNKNEVDLTRKVSVHATNQSVADILQNIFNNTDIVYAMQGNSIMLMKGKKTKNPITMQFVKKIAGTVIDEYGEPLIGVNVSVEGTNNGTITDGSGHFSIAASQGETLLISYIGYTTRRIKIGNTTTIDIELREDTQALEEVVVVGYGTQKKVNLSGSVASVKISDMAESRPITNLSNALAGAAAGVNVTSANNRPGSDDATIKIRGIGTLNNADPLVIIDGVEGTLSNININDVDNISILKDAASSAIYGSRAANGVILVTTKTGHTGKMKLSYNGYVTFQSARKGILEPVSNYADYMEYINEGYNNANVACPYAETSIQEWRADGGRNPLKYPNTNWLDESFQTGVGSNHTVSMQGGSESIQFYGSLGYYDNPGIMENAGYQRYHVLSNITANITDWLKMGLNFNGYYGKSDLGSGEFGWAYATSPAMILKHDGKYGGMQDPQADISESGNNMLASLNAARGDDITRNGKGRFFLTVSPIKDLSVTGSMVYEFTGNNQKVIPVFHDYWNFSNNTILIEGKGQSYIRQLNNRYERNFMDIVANYNHRFLEDKLGVGIMAGASQERYTEEKEKTERKDLIDSSLSVMDAANGELSASGSKSVWAMRSYFGRINLDWENKYLAEFNLRSDGSSRFLQRNRYGWFPSGSVAWRISEEEFMKECDWLDNLKIRASYGSLGNNSVGNYAARSTYSNATYVVNSLAQTGWKIAYLANPLLTWEKTHVADIGLDFNILNNRLSGTFDYFNKKTDGILIQLPIPRVHGTASAATTNAAEVSNRGIELTWGWNDRIGDFSYGVTMNYTHIKNTIDKFQGEDYSLDGYKYIKEGGAIGDMYMYEADRIIQTDADLELVNDMIASNPKAFEVLGRVPTKGDVLFKDLDHNGIIDTDDRTVVGNTNPTDYLGLNLYAAYKGVDLSLSMDGAFGYQGYINESYFSTSVSKDHQISKYVVENAWREGTTNAKYPRLSSQGIIATDNYNTTWMQNRNFWKIRNIQLGYTFPKLLTQKIFVQKLRIYGSLENFFTITVWKGIDPETDNLVYPTMRQAVVGINVEF